MLLDIIVQVVRKMLQVQEAVVSALQAHIVILVVFDLHRVRQVHTWLLLETNIWKTALNVIVGIIARLSIKRQYRVHVPLVIIVVILALQHLHQQMLLDKDDVLLDSSVRLVLPTHKAVMLEHTTININNHHASLVHLGITALQTQPITVCNLVICMTDFVQRFIPAPQAITVRMVPSHNSNTLVRMAHTTIRHLVCLLMHVRRVLLPSFALVSDKAPLLVSVLLDGFVLMAQVHLLPQVPHVLLVIIVLLVQLQ